MAETTFHSIKLPGIDTARAPEQAAEFNTGTTYAVKDYCTYQGVLYRCTTAHAAGAWNASHFTATNLDNEFDRKLDIPASSASAPANPRVGDLWIDNNEDSAIYNVDAQPTSGSTNAVSSGGTYTALNGLETRKANRNLFSGDYSASATYEVNQLVMNGAQLYRCTTRISTPEAWNASHWQATNLNTEFDRLRTSEADTDMIAETFGTSSSYAVGDYVVYNSNLYRCKSAVSDTGSWDPDDWVQVALADDVSDLKNTLNDVMETITSINVLDITEAVPGYYVNQDTGAYEPNANHTVIKDCKISENTIVISTTVLAWNFAVRYALYDSNKTYLSGGLLNNQADWQTSRDRYYHSIDATGASYISISATSANAIFVDSAKTQIANGDVINYEPYGSVTFTKVDSYSDVTVKDEIDRVEDLAVNGYNKNVQLYSNDNLTSGGFIALNGLTLLKEYTIILNAVITSFDKLTIGVCQNQNVLLNRVDIDATTVTNKTFFGTVATYTHGLTIENDIQIRIKVNYNLTADLTIISNGHKFEQLIQWVSTTTPMTPFVLSDGVVTTSCKLTMVSDWNRKIYAVGDSYFNYATNRWAYYLEEYGYIKNVLINASPGIGSNQAKTTLVTLANHGTPKYMLWGVGLNDGSDGETTPQTQWMNGVYDFLDFCELNSIIPVFITIPTVPTINNEEKNAWIRESGYRYIDIAKAVGAYADGVWYDGMLETTTPRIHPTVEGARCMFMQVISDFPEIMVSK